MEAMTIRNTGAEGVLVAFSDALKAAEYGRRLAAATAENDRLRRENDMLRAALETARADAAKARKKSERIYEERIVERANAKADAPVKRWMRMNIFLGGMVAAFAVITGIIWALR